MGLADEHASRIPKGAAPLTREEAELLLREAPRWTLQEGEITREVECADFRDAMAFVNRVAVIAQAEDHHPDICIAYNLVRLTLSTHAAGGLTRNDFIVAAKIDAVR